MAGKFEISKRADGTFGFEFKTDERVYASSPVFEKEDDCKRGVKAVKKNSRMKIQNAIIGDEEKTNPKFLVEAEGEKVKYTLFLQTGAVACTGVAESEEDAKNLIGDAKIFMVDNDTLFIDGDKKYYKDFSDIVPYKDENEVFMVPDFLISKARFA